MKTIIYKVLAGSRLYGTYDKNSDYDYRGIFMPPITDYYKFGYKEFKVIDDGEQDIAYYSLRKFIGLASKCNPNILELLFIPVENVIVAKPPISRVLKMTPMFLNKKNIYNAYKGFGLTEFDKFKRNNKQLKKAVNCVRLLEDAIQLFETGKLVFPSKMTPTLCDIKNGKVTFNEIVNFVENVLNKDFTEAYENSTLPDKTDTKAIENEMVDIIKTHKEIIHGYNG